MFVSSARSLVAAAHLVGVVAFHDASRAMRMQSAPSEVAVRGFRR
jgi:hypothetical protein